MFDSKTHYSKEKIITLFNTPTSFIYKVCLFFYPKQYNAITLDNLINKYEGEEISPLYLNFISQLGDIYTNDEGEKELIFRDLFYTVIFQLVDLKQTKEEKIKLIEDNTLFLIWLDNLDINTSQISLLFKSFNKSKFIFCVLPYSNTHYLIKKYYTENNSVEKPITELECNTNYYINANAYSGIRYLINNIITINDWYHYYPIDNTIKQTINSIEFDNQKGYTNSLMERLRIIRSIIEQN